MTRTTDEWAALLNNTTPGPWGHCIPWGGWNPAYGATPGDEVAKVKRPADHRLVSAAPDAVAEVVRLRQAIEDEIRSLRAPLCSHMPEGDKLDEYLEEWEMQGYAAHILTRILNGDTDE